MRYANIFYELVLTELMLNFKKVRGLIIDSLVWVTMVVATTTYIFPLLGMSEQFGPFILVNSVVSTAFFQIFWHVAAALSDFEGNYTLSYQFTLPIPSSLLWLSKGCGYAALSALISLPVLPFGTVLLWGKFSLAQVNWLLAIPVYLTMQLLVGAIILAAIAFTPSMQKLAHLWPRCLFPMWYLGGTQFAWKTLLAYSPVFAGLSLLNPLMFASEGLRAAVLDPAQSLPGWLCLLVMWCWIVGLAFFAVRKLQKKLDTL